jgi:aspartate/glutamate racemase
MMKATGGKNIFGFSMGILMLESKFPRIPGDMGNATTWDFPVLYKVVKDASPDAVVRKGDKGLLESFITGAKELEKEGVRAITTNCGFLAMFHNEMASAVNVPLFTSSLMQVPLVYAMLQPSQKVGIITINAKTLSQKQTRLISDHPDVGAIVLECTNMTPYAAAIQEKIGLPVFDIYTLVQMVHQAVVRKGFCGYM